MQNTSQRLSPAFYTLLSLPSTAMGFALCVQISALSWILFKKYDLDIDEVAWVWMAGPLAGIFGQLSAGLLSDRIWFMGGRRRPLIVIGGLLAGAMVACLPYLDVISKALGLTDILAVALTVALLLDLAVNVGFNPSRSLIADLTPPGEARTRGYTMMQTVSGFFGVLAYLITALVDNFTLIYVAVFLIPAFTLLPAFLLQEPRELAADTSNAAAQARSNAADPARKNDLRQLLAIYAAHAFTWFGVQTMFVFLYAFVEQKMTVNPDDPNELGSIIGFAFAVMNTVGFVLPAFVLQPLAAKYGRVRVHTVCIAIMSLSYFVVLSVAGNTIALYAAMALIGIGWAAVVSLPFAIMTEYVAANKMGRFMGIFNLSVVIPQLICTLTLGKFFKNAPDLNIIFVVCGVSLGISALLWALLVRERKA
jgi:maltose/moltooligosaccharide transporter